MKDNEIIKLYWNRDEAAITATADTYGNYCYSIAYNILTSNEDSEECVNDTWLNAWNSIPPQRPERLSTYLGKITRNLSLNRYKQLNTQKRGGGQVELTLSELEKFLLCYPKTERNIFLGRYWYLYSIPELATAYRMSESKIASLLSIICRSPKRTVSTTQKL